MIDGPYPKRRSYKTLGYTFLLLSITTLIYILGYISAPREAKGENAPVSEAVVEKASLPTPAPIARPSAIPSLENPCLLRDVVCPDEEMVITHYQAVEAQTDSTPCIGAMAGVDFCNPPFPIVANNCLKLGTKVEIEGTTYTVADRMNKRFDCNHFDILTQ